MSSETARSRARRVWACLGSTVRAALRAHSAAQSYWSCSSRRSRAWAVVMERIQPEEMPKNRSRPMQAAARASST
jgi:hypothetical protein